MDDLLVRVRGQALGGLPQRLAARVGQAHDGEQAPRRVRPFDVALLEGLVDRDVEDARRPFGPLHVATDPEDALGHPAEQGPGGHADPPAGFLPAAVAAVATPKSDSARGPASIGGPATSGVLWRGGSTGIDNPPPTTQVSFEPPPWLELTTRPPSRRATRVRPPGRTQMSSPSLTAKGRRSTWRRTMEWSTQVGDVDKATTRWAIQWRGSASTSRANSSSSAPVAAGPMTRPLPPEPSTRLKTSSSRRASASLRTAVVLEVHGLDVLEDGILAQVVADHGRHVGVDELVVGHAVADAVGDGDPAGPSCVDDARTSDERVGAELQWVEVVVVDAAVDDVDGHLTLGRAQEDVGAVAHQVAPLDQVDPHEAGQQRVLVEGRVVHAGREDHDRRVLLRTSVRPGAGR